MTKSRGVNKPRTIWTPVMLQLLRDWYPHYTAAVVAGALDVPIGAVYSRAHQLGLVKSDEFLASDLSGRVARGKQSAAMRANQFKKGQTSWNKGTHYAAGGRSAETRFKPGQRPATWVPIGSYRVNADGYLDRKVTDEGYGPRDWVSVHRLVWTEANGPVPKGHVVVFKPSRRTAVLEQITLDALELVTRAELMRRNSYHTNYPPEVRALVQLKGAIRRQVNRIAKESS